ncbi:triphosphoribosyl-dephospho-CoA synthase [Metallosphaera tengchongensis]|uniref:Triphosphoribosyl-dephospho-CoA synthase n=2 Tax=Metallosphaera tengchongensis TaxID=1532350 RepID=A0A6N0P0W6_9CREN|nr:triphosphoribosyl-dephospho-CoA synthase [Metallosphaera tengchongensis]
MASILESSIPKPGNASPLQDIETVTLRDIIVSALRLKDSYYNVCLRGYERRLPIMDRLSEVTDRSFSLLGTALLLFPIAYSSTFSTDVEQLIHNASLVSVMLTSEDWKWFREALTKLNLSYLGRTDRMDYRNASVSMGEILRWSAVYDEIAKEIVAGYPLSKEVYNIIRENPCGSFSSNVKWAFIYVLSKQPDGLISRKWGHSIAIKISQMASKIPPCPQETELQIFNDFLRSRKINPGSTADIIAAGIALHEIGELFDNDIRPPLPRGCDRTT